MIDPESFSAYSRINSGRYRRLLRSIMRAWTHSALAC
jgi:hypothetical protein